MISIDWETPETAYCHMKLYLEARQDDLISSIRVAEARLRHLEPRSTDLLLADGSPSEGVKHTKSIRKAYEKHTKHK